MRCQLSTDDSAQKLSTVPIYHLDRHQKSTWRYQAFLSSISPQFRNTVAIIFRDSLTVKPGPTSFSAAFQKLKPMIAERNVLHCLHPTLNPTPSPFPKHKLHQRKRLHNLFFAQIQHSDAPNHQSSIYRIFQQKATFSEINKDPPTAPNVSPPLQPFPQQTQPTRISAQDPPEQSRILADARDIRRRYCPGRNPRGMGRAAGRAR